MKHRFFVRLNFILLLIFLIAFAIIIFSVDPFEASIFLLFIFYLITFGVILTFLNLITRRLKIPFWINLLIGVLIILFLIIKRNF